MKKAEEISKLKICEHYLGVMQNEPLKSVGIKIGLYSSY